MHGTIDIEATIARADSEFPALFQLFGGYFHQDWHDEYATTAAAATTFRLEAPPAAVGAALAEIERVLAMRLDERTLGRLLHDGFGCSYVPQVDELSNEQWLRQLRAQLQPPAQA